MKVVDESEEKEDSEDVKEAEDDSGVTFVAGEETHSLTEDDDMDIPREDGREDEVVTGEECLATEDVEQPEKELVVSIQREEEYPTEEKKRSESPEGEQKDDKSREEETGEEKEEKVESHDEDMTKALKGDISNDEEVETKDIEKESLNETVTDKSLGDDTVAQEVEGSLPLVEEPGVLGDEKEERDVEVATKPMLDVVEEEGSESESARDMEEIAEIKTTDAPKEDDAVNDADVPTVDTDDVVGGTDDAVTDADASKVDTDDLMGGTDTDFNNDKDVEVKPDVDDNIEDSGTNADLKNATDSEVKSETVSEATTGANAEHDNEAGAVTAAEPNQAPSGGDLSMTSTCQVCLYVFVCLLYASVPSKTCVGVAAW